MFKFYDRHLKYIRLIGLIIILKAFGFLEPYFSLDSLNFMTLAENFSLSDMYSFGSFNDTLYPIFFPLILKLCLLSFGFNNAFSLYVFFIALLNSFLFLYYSKDELKTVLYVMVFTPIFSFVGSESLFLTIFIFILIRLDSIPRISNFIQIGFCILMLVETKYYGLFFLPYILLRILRFKFSMKAVLVSFSPLIVWFCFKIFIYGNLTGSERLQNSDSIFSIFLHIFSLIPEFNLVKSVIFISFTTLILHVKFRYYISNKYYLAVFSFIVLIFFSRITTNFDMLGPRLMAPVTFLLFLSLRPFNKSTFLLLLFPILLIRVSTIILNDGVDFYDYVKNKRSSKIEYVESYGKYMNSFVDSHFKYIFHEKHSYVSKKIQFNSEPTTLILFCNSNIEIYE